MRKSYFFISLIYLLYFCLNFSVIAQETITLSTYYPAPFGVYQEMVVHGRMAIGDVNGDAVIDNNDLAVDILGNPLAGGLTVGGRVGIGTNAPRASVEITGKDGTNLLALPAGVTLTYREKAGSFYGFEILEPPYDNSFFLHTEEGSAHQALYFGDADPDDNVFGISTKGGGSSWDAKFVVNQNGNTGIGTKNPQAKLDVNGKVKIGLYTLPEIDGQGGQVLQTDGDGIVSWEDSSAVSGGSIIRAYPVNFDLATKVSEWVDVSSDLPVGKKINSAVLLYGGTLWASGSCGLGYCRRIDTFGFAHANISIDDTREKFRLRYLDSPAFFDSNGGMYVLYMAITYN